MKRRSVAFDWNDLQTFLEAARERSITSAAHTLKVDVTTVRRRLANLQGQIGLTLFVKNGRSLQLTNDGQRAFAIAASMSDLGRGITRDATDAARDVVGIVRVSTMEGFGSMYLAPRLSEFARLHPRVSIELVTSQHMLNLAEREADISLNMARPQRGRLMVRKVAQFGVGLYASQRYLDSAGTPRTIAELDNHLFVTYVDELVPVPHVRWLPDIVASPKTRFTSTSLVAQYEATRSGAGLAMLPHFVASDLIRIMPARINLLRDWWLVVHQDLQTVPRIRAVTDFIINTLRADSRFLLRSKD